MSKAEELANFLEFHFTEYERCHPNDAPMCESAAAELRRLAQVEAEHAALLKAISDAEPVAWLESEESTKDWPVRDLFFGFSSVAYSSRLHFGIRPNTRQGNRLTPLYTLNGIKKP